MSVPTCPNCGKIFTKDSSVTHHLSQPQTSCHSSIRDIVNILQFTQVELPLHHTSPQADAGVLTTDMCNLDDSAHANFNGNFNFSEDGFGAVEGSLEEQYEGARTCYSKDGLTFLDLFNADEFAECRKENLFYPFAFKEEWEIGDFLLRSPLSMAMIDVFLKLPLISTGLHTLQHWVVYLLFRSKNYTFHSATPENCEVVQRCFLVDQAGSVKLSPPSIPPSIWFNYFGGTLSNA